MGVFFAMKKLCLFPVMDFYFLFSPGIRANFMLYFTDFPSQCQQLRGRLISPQDSTLSDKLLLRGMKPFTGSECQSPVSKDLILSRRNKSNLYPEIITPPYFNYICRLNLSRGLIHSPCL